mmetsp:Transcript_77864/g.210528  ORF Transcript_77864/g.210528 Transcript_77864/m.210528 type:complete len:298 (-) Transcript_77864:1522-2415(-)
MWALATAPMQRPESKAATSCSRLPGSSASSATSLAQASAAAAATPAPAKRRMSERPTSKRALRPAGRNGEPEYSSRSRCNTGSTPRSNARTATASSKMSMLLRPTFREEKAVIIWSAHSAAPSSLRAACRAARAPHPSAPACAQPLPGGGTAGRRGRSEQRVRRAAQAPPATSLLRGKRLAPASTEEAAAGAMAPSTSSEANEARSPTQCPALACTSGAPLCERMASTTSLKSSDMSISAPRSTPTREYSPSMSSSRMSMMVQRPASTTATSCMCSRSSSVTKGKPPMAAAAQNKYL